MFGDLVELALYFRDIVAFSANHGRTITDDYELNSYVVKVVTANGTYYALSAPTRGPNCSQTKCSGVADYSVRTTSVTLANGTRVTGTVVANIHNHSFNDAPSSIAKSNSEYQSDEAFAREAQRANPYFKYVITTGQTNIFFFDYSVGSEGPCTSDVTCRSLPIDKKP
jgi:hypothetical protein